MRARRLILVTPLAFFAIAAICPSAFAGPWLPKPGEYYSEFRGSQTSLRTVYDANGSRYTYTVDGAGIAFEERALLSRNEIGWKSGVSVILGLPVETSTLEHGGSPIGLSATGLSDIEFGFKFRVKDGPTAMAIEGIWQAPLGYQTDVLPNLGPGVQQLIGRFHYGNALPKGRGFFQFSGAYRRYSEEFLDHGLFVVSGDAIEGSADVGFWVGSSVLLSGRYELYLGRGDEPRQTSQVISPEVRYRIDERVDVFVGTRHTAAGENVFHEDGVYVGLAARHTSLNRAQGFLGGTRNP